MGDHRPSPIDMWRRALSQVAANERGESLRGTEDDRQPPSEFVVLGGLEFVQDERIVRGNVPVLFRICVARHAGDLDGAQIVPQWKFHMNRPTNQTEQQGPFSLFERLAFQQIVNLNVALHPAHHFFQLI